MTAMRSRLDAGLRTLGSSYAAWLALPVLLGLVARLVYADQVHVASLFGDSFWYHAMAGQVADGHYDKPFLLTPRGLALAPPGSTPSTAWHPPLFPMVLALANSLGFSSWEAHQTVGCLLGAGTVAIAGLLGRRLAGSTVGLVAATLTALYLPLIAWDSLLLSESLFALLVAGSLLGALRAIEAPTVVRLVAVGLVGALATLARAEGALLVALLSLVIALRVTGSRLRALTIPLLAATIALAPWLVRNLTTFERPVLLSTGYQPVVLGANCPASYYGAQLGSWDFGCVAGQPGSSTLVIAAARTPDEATLTQAWLDHGLGYAAHHLGRLPLVIGVRILRSWQLYRPATAESLNIRGHGHWSAAERAATLSYFGVALAALGGVILLLRRRRSGDGLWILLVPIAFVTLTSALSFGETRIRVGAEVSLVVLAATAAVSAARALMRRDASPRGAIAQ
ncbi:MAG TPA: glycosyltransferase family 39 protein [Solirubrobacteraceae bacterium]|nr:glycosyltransferase family 39 protein [Solirubrobacteraceae bacterium]